MRLNGVDGGKGDAPFVVIYCDGVMLFHNTGARLEITEDGAVAVTGTSRVPEGGCVDYDFAKRRASGDKICVRLCLPDGAFDLRGHFDVEEHDASGGVELYRLVSRPVRP